MRICSAFFSSQAAAAAATIRRISVFVMRSCDLPSCASNCASPPILVRWEQPCQGGESIVAMAGWWDELKQAKGQRTVAGGGILDERKNSFFVLLFPTGGGG